MAKVKVSIPIAGRKLHASKKKPKMIKDVAGKSKSLHVYESSSIILKGLTNKPENKMTALEKMEKINLGVSKKDLEALKTRTSLDYEKLAKLLSVTRATLINKPKLEKFGSALSERILGLADIYSYGYEVFEDEEKFNHWMFRQNKALGGHTPFEVSNNQFGREEVKNIIGRIDYGVYS